MKSFFLQLVSATQGRGPSSTRLVYLVSHMAAVFCAITMSVGGILVYCIRTNANPSYWWAVGGLWATILGVGGLTKVDQQKRSKEIVIRTPPGMAASMASGD